jgi:hypothetical protein
MSFPDPIDLPSRMERADLLALGEAKIAEWGKMLAAENILVSQLLLCGSVCTGLFTGPRSATYSGADAVLAADHEILEMDVRLVLDRRADAFANSSLASISRATGTTLGRVGEIFQWGTNLKQANLYRHDALDKRTTIEWELKVNSEPYFETAPYWSDVFSPVELAQQRGIRQFAVTVGTPPSEYESLKRFQSREFRWRLCTGLGWLEDSELPGSMHELRERINSVPVLRDSVRDARDRTLKRPKVEMINDRLRTKVESYPVVPPPSWVALLEQIAAPDRQKRA